MSAQRRKRLRRWARTATPAQLAAIVAKRDTLAAEADQLAAQQHAGRLTPHGAGRLAVLVTELDALAGIEHAADTPGPRPKRRKYTRPAIDHGPTRSAPTGQPARVTGIVSGGLPETKR